MDETIIILNAKREHAADFSLLPKKSLITAGLAVAAVALLYFDILPDQVMEYLGGAF